MKIDTNKWKEFLVSEVFDCKTTKAININIAVKGDIPYITRSNNNNGCSGRLENIEYINKGNCITIGAEGKIAFYQKDDFIAGVKIYTLRNKAINKYTGLFLTTVLNTQVYLYSYGRARILEKIKNETIKLPAKDNGMPDFEYMECFIKSLHYREITTSIEKQNLYFNVIDWQEFSITELFTVSVSNDKNLQNSDFGNTAYVASSSENNGVTSYINAEPSQSANTLTIARNGSIGSTFFHAKPYCASPDDVRILTPRFNITHYTALFIKTIIENEKYKYAYGRKLGTARIKNMKIKLPVNSNNKPDFEYMENFIKSLPYSDRV
jgi:hypothetical protein